MEVVVEGEGRAGGHSEPVGVDEEPDGRTAEVPGGPEAEPGGHSVEGEEDKNIPEESDDNSILGLW